MIGVPVKKEEHERKGKAPENNWKLFIEIRAIILLIIKHKVNVRYKGTLLHDYFKNM